MPDYSLKVSHEVHASQLDVWAVLTDLDNAAAVMSGVTEIERLNDGDYAVGTRWRETRKMMGKQATEEMWVTDISPPNWTVVTARSGGAEYTSEFTVTPNGETTTLTMTFSAELQHPSLVQRTAQFLFGRLGSAMTKKVVATDLADLAAAAEAR
ncbi:MAG: SRPBCC family protein [Actinobacteria bacterium]|nr:SRPBCC family protein [Actinomycetota bacterium]